MKTLVLTLGVLFSASAANAGEQFFINNGYGQTTYGYAFRSGNSTFINLQPSYPVYQPYYQPIYAPAYYRPCAPVYQPAYVPTWNLGYWW
jgi:hypothetical protein